MGIEGIDLGRYGSISLISIYVRPTNKVYSVDVQVLKGKAFTTTDDRGNSLKSILESTIPKVIFDVKKYSDALFNLFQISVDGITDVQLMELALRKKGRKYFATLDSCVHNHSKLSGEQKYKWSMTKVGCDYEELNERPLRSEIIRYCVQNVTVLGCLWDIYNEGLKLPSQAMWRCLIRETTKGRIAAAKGKHYKPQDSRKALSPWHQEVIDDYIYN